MFSIVVFELALLFPGHARNRLLNAVAFSLVFMEFMEFILQLLNP